MTQEEAFKILSQYQMWRRYDGPIGKGPDMPNPTDIGKAIDVALGTLEENRETGTPPLPSNLDEAAWKYADESCFDDPEFTATMLAFKAGAEWMAGQYEKIEGEPVDWYGTSDGKDYCCGIKTVDSFEVPEGFYIRKKQ